MIERDPSETHEQRRQRLNRQAVLEEIRQLRAKAKVHGDRAWACLGPEAGQGVEFHLERMAYNSYSITATILEQQLESQQ